MPAVPPCPASTSSGGTFVSGAGHDDEQGPQLGVLTVAVEPSLALTPTGSASGFAGHVIGMADDKGSRPD